MSARKTPASKPATKKAAAKKAPAKKAAGERISRRKLAAERPDGRKKRNITTQGGHVPRELIDPAFLSEADMAKRETFAQAYVAHGNIADAAEAAGYNGKNRQSLTVMGLRLYQEPWVKSRIQEIRDDLLHELKITQRKVLGELARIGFVDIGSITDDDGDILPLHKISVDTRRAISSYKVKRSTFGEDGESVEREVRFESKSGALEKLGKHAGLFGKADDDAPGVAAEDFMRALGEGIARVIAGRRTIDHQP